MAKYFGIPFASTGDKIAVPDATQPDGSVSYSQGFGFDYERPNTDPGYKPVPREQTNQLYFDLTEAVGVIQRQGVADWTVDAQPYQINALVRHTNKIWRSKITNNNTTPIEGTDWTEVGVLATETVPGSAAIATTAQAQAMTDDTRFLTPLKAGQALVGRLINIQTLTTAGVSTYTPTAGTKSVFVEVVGGGAAGGGAQATNASQASFGGGGGGGAYARKRLTSGFSGVTVTVGAGGAGVSGQAGAGGGASSFGVSVTAPGGLGGVRTGPDSNVNQIAAGGSPSAPATGGDINARGFAGSESRAQGDINSIYGGFGGGSFFGAGAARVGNGAGIAATTPGAGGGGATNPSNQASAFAGGSGAPGAVIIWEYA